MEMVPMRTDAAPGQVVNFVCAYFSMEPLQIDIQPIGYRRIDGKLSARTQMTGTSNTSAVDILARFPWGHRRSLSLLIDASHRQVKCRVTNTEGLVLGELTALIQPQGSPANNPTQHNSKFNHKNPNKKHKSSVVKNRPSQSDNVPLLT